MFNLLNLFSKDESSNWQPSHKIPLGLDLQTQSLNNVRIGDSAENLRAFGRPGNKKAFKLGRFEYFLLGFEAEIENGNISNFCFMFNAQTRQGYIDCELTVSFIDGKQIKLTQFTTLSNVEEMLGIAADKKIDKAEGYCYNTNYRQGDLILSFWWLENGRIEELIVENYNKAN